MVQTREEKIAYNKKYYQSHRDEALIKAKKYRDTHKEEMAAYRDGHREEAMVYNKKYNRDRRERVVYDREHYLKNKEKMDAVSKKWRLNNKEKLKDREKRYARLHRKERTISSAKYHHNHPEVHRRASRKRRLKKRQLKQSYTTEQWNEKVAATHGACPQCGRQYDDVYPFCVTVDHVPSISIAPIGFCYTINDVSPRCGGCNTSNYVHSNSNTTLKNFGGIK